MVTIQERRRKPSVLRLSHEVQVLGENGAQHNVQREVETWDLSENSKNINLRNRSLSWPTSIGPDQRPPGWS
jgi:hypothetical protein